MTAVTRQAKCPRCGTGYMTLPNTLVPICECCERTPAENYLQAEAEFKRAYDAIRSHDALVQILADVTCTYPSNWALSTRLKLALQECRFALAPIEARSDATPKSDAARRAKAGKGSKTPPPLESSNGYC